MNDQKPRKQQNLIIIGLSGCLVVLLCIMCAGALALGGLFYWEQINSDSVVQNALDGSADGWLNTAVPTLLPTPTLVSGLSTLPPGPQQNLTPEAMITDAAATAIPTPSTNPPTPEVLPTPTPAPLAMHLPAQIEQQFIAPDAYQDIATLYLAEYPPYDYFETAVHLGKHDLGARAFARQPYNQGDVQAFQTESGTVEATLIVVTDHIYFWVENGLDLEETAVQTVVTRLEEDFYPQLAYLFEHEWQPGIDGDPHFSVLHLNGTGNDYELGYFFKQDEYPRTLFSESNEQEIVYLNMDQLELGSDLYYGTLVHEIQHLFQWHLDKNEATWLNEGLSQLAELYVGLDTAWADAYLQQPTTRLNSWDYDEENIDAHYSASYLFVTYFWEQLGDTAVRELVRNPSNGLASVYQTLKGFKPQTSLEDFMANWAVANYLDDFNSGAEYGYVNLDLYTPNMHTRARQLPFNETLSAEQFSVQYVDLDISGMANITFAADTYVTLTTPPPSGSDTIWYVPALNDTHAQIISTYDLTNQSQATLTFDTWYDLEEDYDFAYVEISADNGTTWNILYPEHGVAGKYGPALNGHSDTVAGAINGWVQEAITLDSFVGQNVQIRFQVLTDFEGLGRGFALDNIAINTVRLGDPAYNLPPINITTQGFSRIGHQIPQQWALRVVRNGSPAEVLPVPLNAYNQVQFNVDLGVNGGTLIIIPLTPFTSKTANYWLNIE